MLTAPPPRGESKLSDHVVAHQGWIACHTRVLGSLNSCEQGQLVLSSCANGVSFSRPTQHWPTAVRTCPINLSINMPDKCASLSRHHRRVLRPPSFPLLSYVTIGPHHRSRPYAATSSTLAYVWRKSQLFTLYMPYPDLVLYVLPPFHSLVINSSTTNSKAKNATVGSIISNPVLTSFTSPSLPNYSATTSV